MGLRQATHFMPEEISHVRSRVSKCLVCAGGLTLHRLPQPQNAAAAHSRLIAGTCSQILLKVNSVDTKLRQKQRRPFRIGQLSI